jgi:hypothetical protein
MLRCRQEGTRLPTCARDPAKPPGPGQSDNIPLAASRARSCVMDMPVSDGLPVVPSVAAHTDTDGLSGRHPRSPELGSQLSYFDLKDPGLRSGPGGRLGSARGAWCGLVIRQGVPTAVLRAGMITGSGSASFEVRRYLTTAAGKALFSYRHAHLCVCRYCYETATTARTRAPALACHAGPAQAHDDSGPAEA